MKTFMLALLAGVLLLGGVAYAANDPIHRLTVGDSEVWSIDEEGDVTAAGSLTAPDITASDDLVVGDDLRTATSTPYSLIISSAGVDITSAPDEAGIIGITNAYVMYVSTGTGTAAWVKIGGQ